MKDVTILQYEYGTKVISMTMDYTLSELRYNLNRLREEGTKFVALRQLISHYPKKEREVEHITLNIDKIIIMESHQIKI